MSDGRDSRPGAPGGASVATDAERSRVERPAPVGEPARGVSTARRQRDKDRRLAERGDRILDALATLIARWGYGKTTVDDIAREAGVAKGTVYLHWPAKDAMLHALLEREEQQWNALILERMAADPGDGTLSSLYRHALILCAGSPLLRALFTQDRDALGEWTRSPQSRTRSRRRMEAMHTLLRALRAAGLLRTDLSVEAQAYLLAALLYGILTLGEYMPPGYVPPFAEVADAFAVMVRRGFETEPADSGEEQARRARGSAEITALMNSVGETTAASSQAAYPASPAQTLSNGDDAEHTAQSEYTGEKEVSA